MRHISAQRSCVTLLLLGCMMLPVAGIAVDAPADPNAVLANDLALLFRSARKVISDHQALINDAAKADKGLTADVVIEKTKENYAVAAKKPFPDLAEDSLRIQAFKAILEAERKTMESAQSLINEPGKGFKGFLPAVFAGQIALDFSKAMSGKIAIKLTAPESYIRNRRNRPDAWEHKAIETLFKSPNWEKGQAFSEVADHKGRRGLRLILPEYYNESCLSCHGTPKGEVDITGGIKEGGALGDLGGAISVVIYGDR